MSAGHTGSGCPRSARIFANFYPQMNLFFRYVSGQHNGDLTALDAYFLKPMHGAVLRKKWPDTLIAGGNGHPAKSAEHMLVSIKNIAFYQFRAAALNIPHLSRRGSALPVLQPKLSELSKMSKGSDRDFIWSIRGRRTFGTAHLSLPYRRFESAT